MWHYLWPLFLIVCSNVVYNLSTKSTPQSASPFFSLLITYLVGAAASLVLFFFTSQDRNLLQNIAKINWTSVLLGLAVVGLETGYLFLYRAGWNISKGPLTANILLSSILLIVGALVFHETISVKQLLGVAVCFVGLVLISSK